MGIQNQISQNRKDAFVSSFLWHWVVPCDTSSFKYYKIDQDHVSSISVVKIIKRSVFKSST